MKSRAKLWFENKVRGKDNINYYCKTYIVKESDRKFLGFKLKDIYYIKQSVDTISEPCFDYEYEINKHLNILQRNQYVEANNAIEDIKSGYVSFNDDNYQIFVYEFNKIDNLCHTILNRLEPDLTYSSFDMTDDEVIIHTMGNRSISISKERFLKYYDKFTE